jgi:hypothetical protein
LSNIGISPWYCTDSTAPAGPRVRSHNASLTGARDNHLAAVTQYLNWPDPTIIESSLRVHLFELRASFEASHFGPSPARLGGNPLARFHARGPYLIRSFYFRLREKSRVG